MEAGCGYGFDAGGGYGLEAGSGPGLVGLGFGLSEGAWLYVGKGEGLESFDATLVQRLDESLMWIALAGPQPKGVVDSKTTPMTARVSTVTETPAMMRCSREPRIISLPPCPFAGSC